MKIVYENKKEKIESGDIFISSVGSSYLLYEAQNGMYRVLNLDTCKEATYKGKTLESYSIMQLMPLLDIKRIIKNKNIVITEEHTAEKTDWI